MTAPQRPPRIFDAEGIVSGRINRDGYPFRYLVVAGPAGSELELRATFGRSGVDKAVDQTLTAVEILETRGWQLVSVDPGTKSAVMRRG